MTNNHRVCRKLILSTEAIEGSNIPYIVISSLVCDIQKHNLTVSV